jgi:LemA protein
MFPGAALILVVVAMVVPVFFVLIWVVGGYNRLVGSSNNYKRSFAQLDKELKGRYDLIPGLVEIAKGYLVQEPGTLEAVMAARNSASAASLRAAQFPGDPAAMKELSGAETALMGTLGRLMVAARSCPDLKADASMRKPMEELGLIDKKIELTRQAYNDAAMNYNTLRETFPTNLIANPLSFSPAELFLIEKPQEAKVSSNTSP